MTATLVAVGAESEGSNAPRTPGMPAGIEVGDQLYLLAAIRNSGTGTVDEPAGWDTLVDFGNVRLMQAEYDGVMTAPTVTFTGGVAGATNHAQIAAFRDASGTVHNSNTVLSGSAQNIATPALTVTADGALVIYAGWKQDDWTSATSPGTEIAEVTTTTGDDAGFVWSYLQQVLAANVSASSFTITGGASAISRGIVVALDPLRPDLRGQAVDTDLSTLDTGIDDNDTSLSVASTGGVLWTVDADDWDTALNGDGGLFIVIGGERMRVTNISGANSPQTFTVARSVNGVVKAHLAGAAVHVAHPARAGL
jgi:hypothetical protein